MDAIAQVEATVARIEKLDAEIDADRKLLEEWKAVE